MRGNLESKFAAHGTKPLELREGKLGLEKQESRKNETQSWRRNQPKNEVTKRFTITTMTRQISLKKLY